MEIIPLTRAKARFSEIVACLIHRREAIVITRKKIPVAALVPYEEWAKKEASEKAGLAAAAGALADFDAEIDAMVDAIYAARTKAQDRDVPI
ncbi:MAG: type II toxin-antitoxin system Phd/YefM family antitoxin [Candidatus Aminicenantales bacterium]